MTQPVTEIETESFPQQNPILPEPVTQKENASQTESYPQQTPIVQEPVTEIHNGKQYIILIDYAELAAESAIKIKFFEL